MNCPRCSDDLLSQIIEVVDTIDGIVMHVDIRCMTCSWLPALVTAEPPVIHGLPTPSATSNPPSAPLPLHRTSVIRSNHNDVIPQGDAA